MSDEKWEDPPQPKTPEEALQMVHDAMVKLSDPYVMTIGIGAWALLALVNYDKTGIVSEKQPLLHVIDTKVNEFETLYYSAHGKLGELQEAIHAVQARKEST